MSGILPRRQAKPSWLGQGTRGERPWTTRAVTWASLQLDVVYHSLAMELKEDAVPEAAMTAEPAVPF